VESGLVSRASGSLPERSVSQLEADDALRDPRRGGQSGLPARASLPHDHGHAVFTMLPVFTMLAVFTSSAGSSDIMMLMEIPSLGGMLIPVMTMFAVPVLYCLVKEVRLKVGAVRGSGSRVSRYFRGVR